jgi:NitT/TauT family transport system substrate-binding protein
MSMRADRWNRRRFLQGFTLAGASGLVGFQPPRALAEPPPETNGIRLSRTGIACEAPQYVVRDLLRAERLSAVEYLDIDVTNPSAVSIEIRFASGAIDIGINVAATTIVRIDAGDPITLLAGVHAGCFELFGTDRIRSIRDLKGKTVAVTVLGGAHQTYVATMAAHIGLDPGKDVTFVAAYLGFPPIPQELRARKIGRVVVNSAVDRTWSQYFCCMVVANIGFAWRNPVATRRALRAFLKATDVCALEPERAARSFVDGGFTVTTSSGGCGTRKTRCASTRCGSTRPG